MSEIQGLLCISYGIYVTYILQGCRMCHSVILHKWINENLLTLKI